MDTIESEEKIVWSNGMMYLAEKHGFGNLGTIIAWISENEKVDFYKSKINLVILNGA